MKDMLKKVNYQELFDEHKVEHVDAADLRVYQDVGLPHGVSAGKMPVPASERIMLYDMRNETDGILIMDDEKFGRLGLFEDIRDDETVAYNCLGTYISSKPKEHFQAVFTMMGIEALDAVKALNKALAPLKKTIVLSVMYGSEVKYDEKAGSVGSSMLTREEMKMLVRFVKASAKYGERDLQEFDKKVRLNKSYVSLFGDIKKQR